jgi:pimeloyl-ACP methyl ester carboxylesterase
MSDRSFWDGQHAAFAERFRVIALDLAGHGESGQSRQELGIPQFGRDAAAVMDAECVSRAVLIGNSAGRLINREITGAELLQALDLLFGT